MSRRSSIVILLCFLVALTGFGETLHLDDCPDTELCDVADVVADDVAVPCDSGSVCADDSVFRSMPWYKQLFKNGFEFHDPRINYPRFPRLCLNIYDWGDRTFNSYDKNYVVGVGKNWKVVAKNYNWMTSYMMFFEKRHTLHMRSDIFNDLGAYLHFMAVSVGYTAKVDNLVGHGKKTRENYSLSFTSSLFTASLNYWKTLGDMKITHFGDYNDGRHFVYDFDAVRLRSFSVDTYYFFNHLKYSHAAAYCFSKYQLKSAGSWLVGIAFNHQTLDMDFSALPQEMKEYLPLLDNTYRFRFNDYDILGGYGYNWVPMPKKWLVNATILPSIGYRYSYRDSSDGKRDMFSANMRAMCSAVYNHKSFFASLTARFDGHLYFNRNYTFFDSIESLSLVVGARF